MTVELDRASWLSLVGALAVALPSYSAAQDVEDGDESPEEIEEIITVGSRLGLDASKMAKQTVVITSEDLEKIGEPDLGRTLARIPQNWGGAQTAGAFNGSGTETFNGAYNINGAVSLNLRGLGTRETLVLVNGMRIGAGDITGNATDIAGIPKSAVERIEIVLDGASAIYGADALGGVVNIILKEDYQGVSTSLRVGSPTDGGMFETTANVGTTFSWDSGQLTANVDFHTNDKLQASEADAVLLSQVSVGSFNQLLPSGGGATRPANVYVFQDDGSLAPYNVTTDSYSPALTDFASGLNPSTIGDYQSVVPDEDRTSISLMLTQDVTDSLTLKGNLLWSQRDTEYDRNPVAFRTRLFGSGETARPSSQFNPFEERILVWSIYPEFGIQQAITDTEQLTANLGLEWQVSDNWTAEFGIRNSKNTIEGLQTNSADSSYVTGFNQAFNPWGDGNSPDNADVLPLIFFGDRPNTTENKDRSFDVVVRGSLFDLPAGTVRTSLGGSLRKKEVDLIQETLGRNSNAGSQSSTGTDIGTGIDISELSAEQDIESLFAEVFVPVISGAPGFYDLSLSAAVRRDTYKGEGITFQQLGGQEVGGTQADSVNFSDTTHSFGVVWSPFEALRIKYDRSTAFVAPDLLQVFEPELQRDAFNTRNPGDGTWYLAPPLDGFCDDPRFDPCVRLDGPIIQSVGGNAGLKPQTSTADKYSVELQFDNGFLFGVYYNELVYENKLANALNFIDTLPGVWEALPQLLTFEGDQLVAMDARWQNLSREDVRSYDVRLEYVFDTGLGDFNTSINWTRQLRRDQYLGALPDETPIDMVGIASPKESGLLTVSWQREEWFANWNSSYRGSTTTSGVLDVVRAEYTAYDSSLLHNFSLGRSFDSGFLQDGSVELYVTNITDEKIEGEEFYRAESVGRFAYGSARDPRGRMVFLTLKKVF